MSATPLRSVVEGVPRVAFAPIHDGRFEFTPFPSCLKAVCKHLGRELPYHYLLGASGAAFRLVWHSRRWEGGNIDIMSMTEDPLEPIWSALDAAGLRASIVMNGAAPWEPDPDYGERRLGLLRPHMSSHEDDFRSPILASIDAARPAIAFGVVGPPEACIVTGYDDGGDTLIGWSMFQDHLDPSHDLAKVGPDDLNPPSGFEASGYFRRDDWFRRLSGIVTMEMGDEPDYDEVYLETLRRIPGVLRGPSALEYHTGQAAYEAYLAGLGDDRGFASADEKALHKRKTVHYDAMTMIAERGSGALFLRDVAGSPRFRRAKAELVVAADMCEETSVEMGAWWDIAGGIWDDEQAQVEATADPDVRRRFVPHVKAACDKDLQVMALLEVALEKLSL